MCTRLIRATGGLCAIVVRTRAIRAGTTAKRDVTETRTNLFVYTKTQNIHKTSGRVHLYTLAVRVYFSMIYLSETALGSSGNGSFEKSYSFVHMTEMVSFAAAVAVVEISSYSKQHTLHPQIYTALSL